MRKTEEYPLPRRIADHFCARCCFNTDVEDRRVTSHEADGAHPNKSPVTTTRGDALAATHGTNL